VHVVAHGAGYANTTWRTFCLKPCDYVDRVAVQVSSVSYGITNIDPETEANSSVRGLIPIVDRNLLLYRHGTPNRAIKAVEDDQHGVAASLGDSTTILLDRWVYQVLTQGP
jgi:hypothetical protein